MYLTGIIVSLAVGVPLGDTPANHAQPYHSGAPVIRRFERRSEDDTRRSRWEQYVRRLDAAWKQYRADGSTAAAWETYNQELGRLRYEYLYYDPYLVPFIR